VGFLKRSSGGMLDISAPAEKLSVKIISEEEFMGMI